MRYNHGIEPSHGIRDGIWLRTALRHRWVDFWPTQRAWSVVPLGRVARESALNKESTMIELGKVSEETKSPKVVPGDNGPGTGI
jgi:hypothetical protein